MRHVLQIPIAGMTDKGQHTHECEFCEKQMICEDTFYVRTTKLGDTVLCRTCAEIPEMQRLFKALPRLLAHGSNMTDKHGPIGPAEE